MTSDSRRIQEESDITRCIASYQTLQILMKMFNKFLKYGIMPGLMICTIAIQILGTYVCINLHAEIKNAGFPDLSPSRD